MSENLPELNDQIATEITTNSTEKGNRAKLITIIVPCVIALIAVAAVFFGVIKPKIDMGKRYDEALGLLKEEKYDEAISLFKTTPGYKDTASKLVEAEKAAKEKALYEEVMQADGMELSKAVQKLGSISELSKEDQTRLALWQDILKCDGNYSGTNRIVGDSTRALDNNWDLELHFIVKEGIVYNDPLAENADPVPVKAGEDDYDYLLVFPSETIWFSAEKARMQNKYAVFFFER